MKKTILLIIIGLSFVSIFSVNIAAEPLTWNTDELIKIKDSEYKVQAYNILRNLDGELISVTKTVATSYLEKDVTHNFVDTLPIVKTGIVNGKNVEMREITVEYNYEKCLTQVFEVPGYDEECAWYHRAFITSLGVRDNLGERYEIFRGLHHSYIVKPSDSVITYWTIIRSD